MGFKVTTTCSAGALRKLNQPHLAMLAVIKDYCLPSWPAYHQPQLTAWATSNAWDIGLHLPHKLPHSVHESNALSLRLCIDIKHFLCTCCRHYNLPHSCLGWIVKPVCVCACVCLSICGISWSIFNESGTELIIPKSKHGFVGGQYGTTPSPISLLNPPFKPVSTLNVCKLPRFSRLIKHWDLWTRWRHLTLDQK